jgi:AraC-like DNA-binding protein
MKAQYEAIQPLLSNSFKVFLVKKKEFDSPYHYHSGFELTYILFTKGIRYVGNRFEDYYEDDLVMFGPYIPHCWNTIGNHEKPATAIVIQWEEDFLGANWMNCKEFTAIRELFQRSRLGIKFHQSVAREMKDEFTGLVDLPSFDRLIRFLQILERLAHEPYSNSICMEEFRFNLSNKQNERVDIAIQYLKDHYPEKITLDEIASKVNMTRESFSRFFSKKMKKTFFQVLNEFRIEMVCKQLIETEADISQICYTCGYNSLPFFYKQFKELKGCTPINYRKSYRKGPFSMH